jgi:putative ABC transport system substrate-binding protein
MQTAGKAVELVRELLPSARRLGVLIRAWNPFTTLFVAQIKLSADAAGIETRPILVGSAEGLDAAFAAAAGDRLDVVILQSGLSGRRAGELALRHRLPAVSVTASLAENSGFIEAGGVMSYAASSADVHRDTADYVDRILKGSKPADLPVRQPTKFELIVNLKTARALGLTMPPALLVRADEVIE